MTGDHRRKCVPLLVTAFLILMNLPVGCSLADHADMEVTVAGCGDGTSHVSYGMDQLWAKLDDADATATATAASYGLVTAMVLAVVFGACGVVAHMNARRRGHDVAAYCGFTGTAAGEVARMQFRGERAFGNGLLVGGVVGATYSVMVLPGGALASAALASVVAGIVTGIDYLTRLGGMTISPRERPLISKDVTVDKSPADGR